MNSFDTLIFPVTNILQEEYFPLLLFCSPLHFLQPVEPGPDKNTDAENDLFCRHGLWRAHVPEPLGDNRSQFLHLIDDIRKRKEFYLDKLSALTTHLKRGSASTAHLKGQQELVTSLLAEHGIPEKDIKGQLQLWQSRLILSIAEVQSDEENALQEEIAYFDEEEIAVLRSLKNKDAADVEDMLKEIDGVKKQGTRFDQDNIINCFDAWLYLMHQKPLPAVKLWLASTRTAAEQILTRYEAASGNHAVPVFKLALPATISASTKYVVERVEAFHRATTFIHRGLVNDFIRLTTTTPYDTESPDDLLPYGTDWADQWETILYDAFPAAQEGRTDMTFYLLPGHPVGELFGSPDGVAKDSVRRTDKGVHGLLGVLGSR
jgi:hypothetical protein